MGTSKRYADHVDAMMNARILERVAAQGELQTLTPAELDLAHSPVTIDPQPKPVRVWVRFGSTPVVVDAEACRWTADALGVRFRVGERQLRCWVYLGAVVSPAHEESAPSRR